MTARTLEERVDLLEKTIGPLKVLPGRMATVESQIVQLRTEMKGEFSAIRGEMATDLAAIRQEMATKQDLEAIRQEMATKQDLEAVRQAMATKADLEPYAKRDDLARMSRRLRADIRDLKTQMLVLHEDLVERIKLLGDAWARRPAPEGTPKRRR